MAELRVRKRKPPTERLIDETIADSFPASDPPAIGHTERPGTPKDPAGKSDDRQKNDPDT